MQHKLLQNLSRTGKSFWADTQPATLNQILDLALQFSQSDWVDPNQRAAAITVALALMVCPQSVWFEDEPYFERIRVTYLSLNADFPIKVGFEESDLSVGRILRDECGRAFFRVLPSLAETYQDHERNMEAKKFLVDYLPKAGTKRDRAALLGIAWAKLQRMKVGYMYRITGEDSDSGDVFTADDIGVSVVISKLVVASKYPGL